METTITGLEIISNTELEFISGGRVYILEIGQSELNNAFGMGVVFYESPFDGVTDKYDVEPEFTLSEWDRCKFLSEYDFIRVITTNQESWQDVTEYSDKGIELLKKQARSKLLSWILTTANKTRSIFKSMSTALHTAWTRAKILATGIVKFVKVDDIDKEGEIPVFTRRVATLEKYGVTGLGKRKSNGLMKFIDLDKIDSGLPPAACIISMHVWQVVDWH